MPDALTEPDSFVLFGFQVDVDEGKVKDFRIEFLKALVKRTGFFDQLHAGDGGNRGGKVFGAVLIVFDQKKVHEEWDLSGGMIMRQRIENNSTMLVQRN